jgi:Conjugative transposon protein TcpC
MARRPKSGDGSWSPVHYIDSSGLAPPWPRAQELSGEMDPFPAGVLADGSLAAQPGIDGGWPGAGGRWLLWPLRVVLWASLLVVAFRGVTAIAFNQGPAAAGGGTRTGSTVGAAFPVAMAEAFAAEFGRVYLSVSPQDQGLREQALAAFVPASVSAADPNLGWNGVGQLNLQLEQVAGIKVTDSRDAVVTLLAMVNGQLMELDVPVAVSGGGVVVSGEPAWLSAPPQPPLPAAASGRSDPVAQSQLMNELPAFFQAYASGDSAALGKFLAPGVSLAGLGGAVTFDSISALFVPPGGANRQITVTVIWQLPEQSEAAAGNPGVTSELIMKYGMSVVGLHTGKWYVKEIGASTEAVGAR